MNDIKQIETWGRDKDDQENFRQVSEIVLLSGELVDIDKVLVNASSV